jgi:hypothetical protein
MTDTVQTAELIHFPVPATPDEASDYWVMDGEDEVCFMHNLPNARNIARLIKQDWPDLNIWVSDHDNNRVFIAGHEA